MKNLARKLALTGIAIAGITLTGCPPIVSVNSSPELLVPLLTRVCEGESYYSQLKISGKPPFECSIEEISSDSLAPKWQTPLSINSSWVAVGDAPSVDKDTNYNFKLKVSNRFGFTEENYTIKVLNVNLPPNTK
jgi:hypothetical protein